MFENNRTELGDIPGDIPSAEHTQRAIDQTVSGGAMKVMFMREIKGLLGSIGFLQATAPVFSYTT
jgi:hypothetical protein